MGGLDDTFVVDDGMHSLEFAFNHRAEGGVWVPCVTVGFADTVKKPKPSLYRVLSMDAAEFCKFADKVAMFAARIEKGPQGGRD